MLLGIGLTVFAALGVLLALRLEVVPVIVMVAIAGLIVTEFMAGHGSVQAITDSWATLDDLLRPDILAMVFLFILLGNLAFYAGISRRIHDVAAIWLRGRPGGLALAAVLGCGGFSAISGSSVACAFTMGRICVPGMLRQGYDLRLASATVAVGGTLGALIPPSLLFVIYGILTGLPVPHLFIAGLLPGLLSLAGMVLTILWWVMESPQIAPAADGAGHRAKARALRMLGAPLALFAVLIGGLFSGLLDAVSAAGASVALVLLVGLAQGKLGLNTIGKALRESLEQALLMVALVIAARLLMNVARITGLDIAVIGLTGDLGLSAFGVIVICAAIYLFLGMFIEPMGVLVLTLPVMVPLGVAHGMDLIWLGVILVKLLEISLITPPVGLNALVITSTTGKPGVAGAVYSGITRFLMVDLLVLVALILFPSLSTLLPSLMG